VTAPAPAPAPATATRVPAGQAELRRSEWFRLRLTARIVYPADPAERWSTLWSAAVALLAAGPLTVWFAAPVAALSASRVLALGCCALPGVVATAWLAHSQTRRRELTSTALREAGAPDLEARLMAECRVVACAALGSAAGALCVWLAHARLSASVPTDAPMRKLLGAGSGAWLLGGSGAVLAGSVAAVAGGHAASIRARVRRSVRRPR
jgi:hypothetical protein